MLLKYLIYHLILYNTQHTTLTPLHWAAGAGHQAVVLILLEKEANVLAFDKDGHRAAWGGHKVVVEMLLGYGANVSAKDKNGRTALHMAAEGGRKKMLLLLLKKGSRR
jgi:ankyrin repeat protein